MNYESGVLVEWKTEVLGEKPTPVPCCLPQVPCELAWDQSEMKTDLRQMPY
jgi:hypothetical protein